LHCSKKYGKFLSSASEDVKGAKMREVTELVKEVPEVEIHDPLSPPATPEPNQDQDEDGRK
jgi:hypothetical protein